MDIITHITSWLSPISCSPYSVICTSLNLTLKMEAKNSSEMSVPLDQMIQCHVPEDSNLHNSQLCELQV
jgi:hypothetical protein